MENLEIENKTEAIIIKVTPTMYKEIKELLEKNRWRMSAFVRVAIQKEMRKLKEEG